MYFKSVKIDYSIQLPITPRDVRNWIMYKNIIIEDGDSFFVSQVKLVDTKGHLRPVIDEYRFLPVYSGSRFCLTCTHFPLKEYTLSKLKYGNQKEIFIKEGKILQNTFPNIEFVVTDRLHHCAFATITCLAKPPGNELEISRNKEKL